MARRRFALALGVTALATPLISLAQQQPKVARIGLLIPEIPSVEATRVEALRAGLRDLGYVEGKNIAIELRSAEGNYERLSELAADLVRLKVKAGRHGASSSVVARAARSRAITRRRSTTRM